MRASDAGVLRLIAVFKFFKAASLIAVGVAALKLAHTDQVAALDHWAARIGLAPGARYVDLAVGRITSIPPHRLRDVGLGSFVYAALFLTEGTGLWLRKRWAEWFTTIITGSLVPLEVYEIFRRPTAAKIAVTLINTGVVLYLVLRLRREQAAL